MVKHVQGILVVFLFDTVLIVVNVLLNVIRQVFRHLREIDDKVHRVQDAVDESFGQLTHRGHLLLTDQLVLGIAKVGGALLDNLFQLDLVFLKFLQTVTEQQPYQEGKNDEIEHHHIPAHQQREGDAEADGCHLRQFAVGQFGLYAESKRAVGQVQECHVLLLTPGTPLALATQDVLVTQLVAIQSLACQWSIIEGIEEM